MWVSSFRFVKVYLQSLGLGKIYGWLSIRSLLFLARQNLDLGFLYLKKRICLALEKEKSRDIA
jgi:hypothetical protein